MSKKIRETSDYAGFKIPVKINSSLFSEIQDFGENDTAVIIEDWAENVYGETKFYLKNKLYGHTDKSGLAVCASIEELDLEEAVDLHTFKAPKQMQI